MECVEQRNEERYENTLSQKEKSASSMTRFWSGRIEIGKNA